MRFGHTCHIAHRRLMSHCYSSSPNQSANNVTNKHPIDLVDQALKEIANIANEDGKSAKDLSMYNRRAMNIIIDAGGINLVPPPDNWASPLPRNHQWQRTEWRYNQRR